MSANPPQYLAKKNPHPRDEQITFDEGPHIYTIAVSNPDGSVSYDSGFTSVTTWNHSHFKGFDADAIIDKMMSSARWSESQYFGMTREQIKAQWDKNRDEAASAGTKMHYDIECYYNECPNENDSTEYKWFLDFERDRTQEGGFGEQLTPYRTEMMVFHEELRLSGSIDMIYEAPDGTLQIYDWKRCKQIKKDNPWDCATRECINHLPDSNYWHYSLQLNTYKAILEQKYGKKVTDLFLVCLHPNNKNQSYQRIRVPILSQEIQDLFEERKQQVSHLTQNVNREHSGSISNYSVYTDGACSKNGAKNAKAGYGIYFALNDPRNVSRRIDGKQTNNRAELTAIIETHHIIKHDLEKGAHITICTDSEYCIKCVSGYGEKMAKKNYMKKKDEPIVNADLVKQVYDLYKDETKVTFKHIRAHTNEDDEDSIGNAYADQLAVASLEYDIGQVTNAASAVKPRPRNKIISSVVSHKHYLNVPYAQKDVAKKLGAKWDPKKKKWYIFDDNPSKIELLSMFSI